MEEENGSATKGTIQMKETLNVRRIATGFQ
jgi:hypothetical protein